MNTYEMLSIGNGDIVIIRTEDFNTGRIAIDTLRGGRADLRQLHQSLCEFLKRGEKIKSNHEETEKEN